ncbi:hypothetical protein E2C01_078297 [Portunus trituberculatus]|uniref:Uncharacterized protein n=1 Tax=Portunus trituberculatus TaxID=210409 RepID=A0A5B7IMK5_PORTR|nr:hypothetical protein [Portunus trituberculatus]
MFHVLHLIHYWIHGERASTVFWWTKTKTFDKFLARQTTITVPLQCDQDCRENCYMLGGFSQPTVQHRFIVQHLGCRWGAVVITWARSECAGRAGAEGTSLAAARGTDGLCPA